MGGGWPHELACLARMGTGHHPVTYGGRSSLAGAAYDSTVPVKTTDSSCS